MVFSFLDPQGIEDRGEKHTLTPSKAQRQPKPKRLRTTPDDTETKLQDEKQVTQVAESIASLSVEKPSNKFYQDCHIRFENLLKENLTHSKGSEASQQDILDPFELQSNSSDKPIATKAVTDTFPSAKYSKRKLVYQNVSKFVSFTQSERGITVLEENSNVSKLKEKLKLLSELISSWQNDIRQLYDQQPIEAHQLRSTCQNVTCTTVRWISISTCMQSLTNFMKLRLNV